jgi:succinyl-CoA synthetase beta subunit
LTLRLFEYEAKIIFAKYGIPTPRGGLAASSAEAHDIAAQINAPVVVKAQAQVAGRGKAGGILFADSPDEAEKAAEKLLSMNIKDVSVQRIRVEEKISSRKELYFSVTVDRVNRCYVAVACSEGGIDIEEMASVYPERIFKVSIDPNFGFQAYHARQVAKKLGYVGAQLNDLASVFLNHYRMAMELDAELAEINPIIEATDGKFVAVDTRLIIDDNALFRHPEFQKRPLEEAELTPQELKAQKLGIAYVKLDGDIGVIGNGAGLVMATLDVVHLYGGSAANFLDVGGGASAEIVAKALDIVFSDQRVKVVFINILGGMTRCDEVAKGIVEVRKRAGFTKPLVIRLVGTNEEEGRRILTEVGVHVFDSMEEAVKKTVEIAKAAGD